MKSWSLASFHIYSSVSFAIPRSCVCPKARLSDAGDQQSRYPTTNSFAHIAAIRELGVFPASLIPLTNSHSFLPPCFTAILYVMASKSGGILESSPVSTKVLKRDRSSFMTLPNMSAKPLSINLRHHVLFIPTDRRNRNRVRPHFGSARVFSGRIIESQTFYEGSVHILYERISINPVDRSGVLLPGRLPSRTRCRGRALPGFPTKCSSHGRSRQKCYARPSLFSPPS